MIDLKSKELIIKPTVETSALADFLSKLRDRGILTLNIDPKAAGKNFRTMHDSKDADMMIWHDGRATQRGEVVRQGRRLL